MQTASVSADLQRLHRKTLPISGYGQRSSKASYDPIAKTGLLPSNGRPGVDGLKTYVVNTGGNPGAPQGGRKKLSYKGVGAPRPQHFANPPRPRVVKDANATLDPKERARRRALEEKKMQFMLRRDGGKTLGAKYLVRNGKARVGPAVTATDDHTDADSDSQKKRVFDVQAVRKIDWDPTSLGLDAISKLAKQKKASHPSFGVFRHHH